MAHSHPVAPAALRPVTAAILIVLPRESPGVPQGTQLAWADIPHCGLPEGCMFHWLRSEIGKLDVPSTEDTFPGPPTKRQDDPQRQAGDSGHCPRICDLHISRLPLIAAGAFPKIR